MSDLLTTDLNYLAILVAGISNMVIGFLWYGLIFGKIWMGLIGKTADELSSNPIIYVVSFLLSLLMAVVLSIFIHHVNASIQSMTLLIGLSRGPCLHGLASSARRRFRTTCTQGSRSGSL